MTETRHPFARGWFVVAFSDQLAPEQVTPLRYFARELVLFRTAAGSAHVMDAHCPHLGAHLGHGGEVVADSLRCPFHAWRFDGATGRCVEIPYAKRIPARAATRVWVVREHSGLIMVWHDPERGAPDYEVAPLAVGSGSWTPWQHKQLEVRTQPFEIIENVVDVAHFMPVHRTQIDTFEKQFDGHKAVQHNTGWGQTDIGGDMSRYETTATYHGPAIQLSEMNGYFPALLLNAHTPIDGERVVQRIGVSLQLPSDPARQAEMERAARMFVGGLLTGFKEDVRIWENKRYLDQPQLADGDGPIMRLRRWYAQFFSPRPT